MCSGEKTPTFFLLWKSFFSLPPCQYSIKMHSLWGVMSNELWMTFSTSWHLLYYFHEVWKIHGCLGEWKSLLVHRGTQLPPKGEERPRMKEERPWHGVRDGTDNPCFTTFFILPSLERMLCCYEVYGKEWNSEQLLSKIPRPLWMDGQRRISNGVMPYRYIDLLMSWPLWAALQI